MDAHVHWKRRRDDCGCRRWARVNVRDCRWWGLPTRLLRTRWCGQRHTDCFFTPGPCRAILRPWWAEGLKWHCRCHAEGFPAITSKRVCQRTNPSEVRPPTSAALRIAGPHHRDRRRWRWWRLDLRLLHRHAGLHPRLGRRPVGDGPWWRWFHGWTRRWRPGCRGTGHYSRGQPCSSPCHSGESAANGDANGCAETNSPDGSLLPAAGLQGQALSP